MLNITAFLSGLNGNNSTAGSLIVLAGFFGVYCLCAKSVCLIKSAKGFLYNAYRNGTQFLCIFH